MIRNHFWKLFIGGIVLLLFDACSTHKLQEAHVEGGGIRIDFDRSMNSRVVAKVGGRDIALGEFGPSEFITVSGREISAFALASESRQTVQDQFGAGQQVLITGETPSLKKSVTVTLYEEFPNVAVFQVDYSNTGKTGLEVNSWTSHHYSIVTPEGTAEPAFWSYQTGSYENRPDWVLPLKTGFKQENFLGMNETDYGGGTPVVDIWRKDLGVGVGHLESVPKLVSLPVAMPEPNRATLGITYKLNRILKPGEHLKTFRTFVTVHQGDYFRTLRSYRLIMAKQGFHFKPAPEDAFSPIWCAWGYGRDFKASQLYGALPIVKKLGFKWVTLDDGWQSAEGDWFLNKKKFPNGDRDIRAMIDKIHASGFRAQLWWAPLSVDPGTELITTHPEQLLLNADGSKQKISYWNAWYLCPADPAVVEYHRDLVRKIIKDWDFDGLKLDGQFMNAVPPCYNPAHKHATPEDSVEGLPLFFKSIYDTALSIKSDALVEFCPCGTTYSFFTMPYMNMSVASDPGSSWQVRLKGKTLKALMGDSIAYFGDHVDMSDGGDDFASTVGVGGVVGTNFTWPVGSGKHKKLDLTPQKGIIWEKWIKIYREKMLSKGEYLGDLYDIGFDRPEGHAIRKGQILYYAFYAPLWSGELQLRGLENKTYRLTDYSQGTDLGKVRGPVATLNAEFKRHLLVEAVPE